MTKMRMMNCLSSSLRGILNEARRNIIKDPIKKKKAAVFYHNSQALLDIRKSYHKELFDYRKVLSGKRHFFCNELYYGNSLYGHERVFKAYSGYNNRINACIEHGVYLGKVCLQGEATNSGLNGLITFSRQRIDRLNEVSEVPVIAIGPYIHYAEPMMSTEEIEQFKKNNGKTLLVFPTHSIDRVETEFDFVSFINEINKVAQEKNIKKIVICLYYKDVQMGRDKIYRDQGFQVVCNGYANDPMFLRRLKTFILLADYTMSNDVGTSVGYCVYLGKPHYIFSQDLYFAPYTKKDMENAHSSESIEFDKNEIMHAFNCTNDQLTDEQMKIVNKYWGFDCIKNQKELRSILKSFN